MLAMSAELYGAAPTAPPLVPLGEEPHTAHRHSGV